KSLIMSTIALTPGGGPARYLGLLTTAFDVGHEPVPLSRISSCAVLLEQAQMISFTACSTFDCVSARGDTRLGCSLTKTGRLPVLSPSGRYIASHSNLPPTCASSPLPGALAWAIAMLPLANDAPDG